MMKEFKQRVGSEILVIITVNRTNSVTNALIIAKKKQPRWMHTFQSPANLGLPFEQAYEAGLSGVRVLD